MNLVIFTPACFRSAIGCIAALVTRELVALGCQVTVVRTESQHLLSTDIHDFGTRVLLWNDEDSVSALVRHSDTCIYQIGNNFEFHEGGIRWLAEFPGLVCLHDFFLGHLFYDWAQNHRSQAEIILQNWCGNENAGRSFSFSDFTSFLESTQDVMLMVEWVCSQSDSVIIHSQWGYERVLNSCPGPVRVVPLVYDISEGANNPSSHQAADKETLKLLTIGHVNPNKRVESVIEAIASNPLLRQRITYQLVGAIEPNVMESLSELAEQRGVKLIISGEVNINELNNSIATSDVVSCLRWPTLEAASASAIEAMLHGKMVIVTDHRFYSEIPDSCAFKIDHDNELAELTSVLISLLEDQSQIEAMGKAAQRWATKTFTPKNYAQQVKETVLDTSRTKPAQNAIDYFTDTLQRWSFSDNPLLITELTSKLDIFELGNKN